MITTRAILLMIGLTVGGCAPFEVAPPEHFVQLEESEWSDYAARAVNAEGVVLAVRDQANEPEGSLTFWTDAIRNRLRTVRGYALIEERDVHAASGEAGHQLRLGRDEGSQTYDYWVTIFATPGGLFAPGHVFVLEAGGRREAFAQVQAAVDRSIEGFSIE
jgi:hypothetical protein